MWRRFYILLSLFIGILLILFVFRLDIAIFFMTPSHDFEMNKKSDPVDYSIESNWLALPEKRDSSDLLYKGETDRQGASTEVDVFFLHPTTYFGSAHWNDPLDGTGETFFTKDATLSLNSSLFNGCCNIYAPLFRQASMGSLMKDVVQGDVGDRLPFLDYAARDVLDAFDYFLTHHSKGRPFIIAGHSQGADLGLHVLARRISGTDLKDRMVAAYLTGRPIGVEKLQESMPDIPVCAEPESLSCLLSWMTVGPSFDFDRMRRRAIYLDADGESTYVAERTVCVNPLSFKNDEEAVDVSKHLGHYFNNPDTQSIDLRKERVGARCDRGALVIEPAFFTLFTGYKNYHLFDNALFYKNIRENVKRRVKAYLNNQRKF